MALSCLGGFWQSLALAEDVDSDRQASEQRILSDIQILASEEFEGRGIGTRGIDRAADYIAEQFQQAGLDTTTLNEGPFQTFDYSGGRTTGPKTQLTLNGPAGTEPIVGQLEENFSIPGLSGQGKLTSAQVVFVGYGIHAPKLSYSDYSGISVSGKVVVILRRTPFQGEENGLFTVENGNSRFASLVTKVNEAKSRGAAAVLFVNDSYTLRQDQLKATESTGTEPDFNSLDRLMVFAETDGTLRNSLPCFHVKRELVDQLITQSGGPDLATWEADIDRERKPQSRELRRVTVTGQVEIIPHVLKLKNVIGVLEGTGQFRHETIVVGAHYDHVGYGGNGSLTPGLRSVHYGADDNASGTASIIEVARRLAARPEKLGRRVVFIAFTAEESGLIGSEYFVNSKEFNSDIVAMFNLDMVGRMRNNFLVTYGVGTSPQWRPLLDSQAAQTSLGISMHEPGAGPTDQNAFFHAGVPVMHFFTGLHHEYHRPTDRVELLNISGIDKVTDLVTGLVEETAGLPLAPDFVKTSGYSNIDRSEKDLEFGTDVAYNGLGNGYLVGSVAQGSAADEAGILAGDVIEGINDKAIVHLVDYELALRQYNFGDKVTLQVRRDGSLLKLPATYRPLK